MIRYIINRILLLIPVIIVVSLIVYTLIELAPGTYVDTIISGMMTTEDIEALRAEYELDKPMLYRYGKYMIRLVQGDLGLSFQTKSPVAYMYFVQRLPNTLILSFTAIIIGVGISIPLGVLAARKAGSITDAVTTTVSLAGVSMPSFWLGLVLVLLFSLRLGWLPAGNNTDGIRSLILPGICSAMTLMATSTRQTRSSMLEVLKADFLRTARAKGAPERIVIRKHALGNALIPIITAVGASICVQLAGSAVVESVFAWPGIGRMLVDGMIARDTPVIIGCSIMTTILYVVVMMLVDLAYAFVDPRIKAQYVRKKRKADNAAPVRARLASPEAGFAAVADVLGSGETVGTAEQLSMDAAPAQSIDMLTQTDRNSRKAEEIDTSVSYSGAQDYVTRRYKDLSSGDSTEAADAKAIISKYKKRSQLGEIWHRLVRNKSSLAGIIILGVIFAMALYSLTMSYDSVVTTNVMNRFAPSSWQYPFGTDGLGRNLFLRVIYGSRYSIIVGFCAVAFSTIIGVALGSLAAYFGGLVDNIIMRASDTLASLPGLLLGMVIMVTLGFSLQNLIIAVGVAGIPHFIRISRASILTVKDNEFVEAARATGLSNLRIILTQVLPNGLSPIIVQVTALLGLNIIFAASLSFLGFGIPAPTPEWGALVSAGREFVRTSPWLTTYPGLFIMIIVLGFNLLGDGLRDALDPKLKK